MRGFGVAAVILTALTPFGCAEGGPDSERKQVQPDPAAASEWPGKNTFCRAASAFEVGSAPVADTERALLLERMRKNAPGEWGRFLDQAVRRLNARGDMASGQHSDFRGFTVFVESACDLNLPEPPD